jgi:hypothetical protein
MKPISQKPDISGVGESLEVSTMSLMTFCRRHRQGEETHFGDAGLHGFLGMCTKAACLPAQN